MSIAEAIARAIEASVCEPGDQCAERFCPDCTRYAQAQADAATARRMHGDNPVFTREQVADAIREGISLVTSELDLGSERDDDLLRLTAAAQLAMLDHPSPRTTLDQVIERNYDEPPAVVRTWWTSWS